jgi:cyanate lyase
MRKQKVDEDRVKELAEKLRVEEKQVKELKMKGMEARGEVFVE